MGKKKAGTEVPAHWDLSDVQCSVVTLVDSIGDVGDTVAIADLTDPGSAVAQFFHGGPVGTLTNGADHGLAGDEDFFALSVAADQTLIGDLQALAAGTHLQM